MSENRAACPSCGALLADSGCKVEFIYRPGMKIMNVTCFSGDVFARIAAERQEKGRDDIQVAVRRGLEQLSAGMYPSYVLGSLAIDMWRLGSGYHPLEVPAAEPYPGFIDDAQTIFRAAVKHNAHALAEFPEIKGIVERLEGEK